VRAAFAFDAWSGAKADLVFCMSEIETAFMRQFGHPARLAPNGASATDLEEPLSVRSRRPRRADRELTYVFVGHGLYSPYREAADLMVQAFADEPELGRLRLVGLEMGRTARSLPAYERCHALTVVDAPLDVRPHLAEADAALMPIFAGSGTRLKVVEAVFAGLPLISSKKAVEGLDLDLELDVSVILEPTPAGVAEAVRRFVDRRDHFADRALQLRKRWLDRYDWLHIGAQVGDDLVRLAGGQSPDGDQRESGGAR
jgi:glycosyltransferase involved in cell wall biosynthesis